jgi:hypothetical protein
MSQASSSSLVTEDTSLADYAGSLPEDAAASAPADPLHVSSESVASSAKRKQCAATVVDPRKKMQTGMLARIVSSASHHRLVVASL